MQRATILCLIQRTTVTSLIAPKDTRCNTHPLCVNLGVPFLNAWENTQVARAMTSVFVWNTRWCHGHSRGETKYRDIWHCIMQYTVIHFIFKTKLDFRNMISIDWLIWLIQLWIDQWSNQAGFWNQVNICESSNKGTPMYIECSIHVFAENCPPVVV